CKRRGAPAFGLKPNQFVNFLENHDQVANSLRGFRLQNLTSQGRLRALTALMLLIPGTPMLFQGQEFGASSPFLFFADHNPELAKAVQNGRHEFMKQFPSATSPAAQACIPAPHDPRTFERCRLNWDERDAHDTFVRLYRDLLTLRRSEAAFRAEDADAIEGAVLGADLF